MPKQTPDKSRHPAQPYPPTRPALTLLGPHIRITQPTKPLPTPTGERRTTTAPAPAGPTQRLECHLWPRCDARHPVPVWVTPDLRRKVAAAATVGPAYSFPAGLLSPQQETWLDVRLTYRSKRPQDRPFRLLLRAEGTLVMPRALGLDLFGVPAAERDHRSRGEPVPPERAAFTGRLFDGAGGTSPQTAACAAVLRGLDPDHNASQAGFLNLACGFGKTMCMASLVCALGVRAVVFVSSKAQMLEALETLRANTRLRAGVLWEDRCEADADVLVAMVQTVNSPGRNYGRDFFAPFGVAFFDEAHHLASGGLSAMLMTKVPCARLVGLSATVRRLDGRTQALHDLLGPILAAAWRPPSPGTVYQVNVGTGGRVERHLRDGSVDSASMISDLAGDPERTRVGAQAIYHALHAAGPGRRVMAVTHRTEQREELARQLVAAHPGLYWLDVNGLFLLGFASAAERAPLEQPGADALVVAAIAGRQAALSVGHLCGKVPSGQAMAVNGLLKRVDVVFAIYLLGKESFNMPECDTEVLLTPVGDMEQLAGRAQRGGAANRLLFFDLVDRYSLFDAMAENRARYFRGQGWQVRQTGPGMFDRLPGVPDGGAPATVQVKVDLRTAPALQVIEADGDANE